MEYSLKQLKRARELSAERTDTQPIFMPVGRIRPETFNQALERIMMTSIGTGMTFQEAFDQLRPSYDYDGDFSEDFEYADDDEFELSAYAEYETTTCPAEPMDKSMSTSDDSTPHKSAEPADGGDLSASADNAEIET